MKKITVYYKRQDELQIYMEMTDAELTEAYEMIMNFDFSDCLWLNGSKEAVCINCKDALAIKIAVGD